MKWWPFGKKTEARDLTSWDLLQGTTYLSSIGPVSPVRASGLPVAQRCIGVVSETLAGVPLKVLQEGDNGDRQDAKSHPLYRVLHDDFNERQTAFEGREALITSLLIDGNAYAEVKRNGRGQVVELLPLLPAMVSVELLANGRLRYKVTDPSGATRTLLANEMLHIRYRSRDGILGQSPIALAATAFALAIAQQDQANAAANAGFNPSGVLSFPDKLSGTGVEDAIAKFRDRFIGQLKSGDPIVLDGGATWSTISFSSKDAEFLESRKLSNLDIARIYGVPPSVVGIVDGANYSNSVEESRALVQRCLLPMSRRIESAMNSQLLTPEARRTLSVEHVLDGITRGDLATRYSAYRVGREGGWLNVNQIRAFESMSNIGPEGDTYVQPMNYGALGGANDNRATIDESKVA